MKTSILTLIIGHLATNLFAQETKDLRISMAVGIFNSPYYTNAKKREFYNFDADYFITERHILSTNFMSGHHRYYDNVRSNNAVPLNTPGYEENTNATADYLTFSVLYKYKLLNTKKIAISIGSGFGIMTQTKLYPFTEGNIVDFRESTWTDLVFPLRTEFDYKLSKHFQIGLIGGLYIHPDYPILGYHAGPRLSYVL
ncbi:MAG: hypothetical protein ACXWV9_01215 [Flavisolibacter sp.]